MSLYIDRSPVSAERLDSALGNLAFFARKERDAAAIYRKLAASELVGKIATRAIVPQVQALFPDWKVHFNIEDNAVRRRYLYMYRGEHASREAVHIYLATLDEKRIEADKLKERAKEREKSAATYTKKAAELPLKVAQLNAVLPYILELEGTAQDISSYASRSYGY